MTPYPSLAAMGPDAARSIGRHLDTTFRSLARGEHAVDDPSFFRLLTGEPHPLGNMAILAPHATLAATRAAVAPLAAGPLPAAVIFPGLEVPPDIGEYLAGCGFVPAGTMPAMGIDIAGMKSTVLPPGYELVRVGDGPDGDEWLEQFAVGYEFPIAAARYFSPASAHADTAPDAPVQFYAIRRNGRIVATSACFLNDGVAGIYCVSTIPAERKQGLGAHATAEPLRLAARLGYRVGILQSSEAGHRVYQALGFADLGGIPLFVRMPG